MRHQVAEGYRPDVAAVHPLEVAISRYVATVSTVAWTPKADPPGGPVPGWLREAGVPAEHLDDPALSDSEVERRTLLNALLVRDGYECGEDAG